MLSQGKGGVNVPGQTPLSREVLGQNHFPKSALKTEKGRPKTEKRRSKTKKRHVLKQERMFLNRKGQSKTGKDVLKQEIIEKKVIVPSRVPSRILAGCHDQSCTVPWQDFELVPLSRGN